MRGAPCPPGSRSICAGRCAGTRSRTAWEDVILRRALPTHAPAMLALPAASLLLSQSGKPPNPDGLPPKPGNSGPPGGFGARPGMIGGSPARPAPLAARVLRPAFWRRAAASAQGSACRRQARACWRARPSAAALAAAHRLHHVRHGAVHLEHAVDVLDLGAGAGGDALLAAGLEEVGAACAPSASSNR